MDKKDLYRAIGDLEEETLNIKPRRRYGRWVGSIAALLVLAVGIGWYLKPVPREPVLLQAAEPQPAAAPAPTVTESPAETLPAQEPQSGPVSLASPAYPQMPDYPQTSHGMPESQDAFDAWQASVLAQTRDSAYVKDLAPFFRRSMATFLSGDTQTNQLCSPANIYMALSMLAEITDGDTRQEILNLLNVDSLEALRQQAGDLWNAQYQNDKATYMILANSMWLNDALHLNRPTLENLSQYYYAASFAGTPGSAQMDQALQNWINEQTGGLLENQAKDLHLDPNTVIALASTLRYQAKWTAPFHADRTVPDTFHSPNGPETVDFLRQDLTSTHYWGDRFDAVPLNLQNGGGTMWLVLPREGTGVQELLEDPGLYEFLEDPQLGRQENAVIHLSMPRFDVVSDLDLSDGLQALGIEKAFTPEADFTPLLDPAHPDGLHPSLTQCSHAVRVAVDEEGITAAAYTEMGMTYLSAPPAKEVDFILDRPFLFVIQSKDHLPLFAGVVNHP